jgi:hypothetical protein
MRNPFALAEEPPPHSADPAGTLHNILAPYVAGP